MLVININIDSREFVKMPALFRPLLNLKNISSSYILNVQYAIVLLDSWLRTFLVKSLQM